MSRIGAYERWPDADLLAAIAQRDREACTVFYRRHLPRTLAHLMRETRDPEVTADLAAEVFSSVIASAHRYRPQTDTAAPWVIAIARNALGVSRRRGRIQDRVRRRLAFEPITLYDDDLENIEAIAAAGQEFQARRAPYSATGRHARSSSGRESMLPRFGESVRGHARVALPAGLTRSR